MDSISKFSEAKEEFLLSDEVCSVSHSSFLGWLISIGCDKKTLDFFKSEIWCKNEAESNHGIVYNYRQIINSFKELALQSAFLLPIGSGCNGDLIVSCLKDHSTGWLPIGQICGEKPKAIRDFYRAEFPSIGEFFWHSEFRFEEVAKDWHSAPSSMS